MRFAVSVTARHTHTCARRIQNGISTVAVHCFYIAIILLRPSSEHPPLFIQQATTYSRIFAGQSKRKHHQNYQIHTIYHTSHMLYIYAPSFPDSYMLRAVLHSDDGAVIYLEICIWNTAWRLYGPDRI